VYLIYSWKNLLKSVEAMGVFDIVIEKPAEVIQVNGCVWYSHGKTCWSQSRRWMCLIVMGSNTHLFNWLQKVFPWLSNTSIASTDFSRFFHDYIKHTHWLDWLQQVFQWLYQTPPSPRLTSAGFSMNISNTPIASTDFSRFLHNYIKHTHRFDGLQQVFPWLYQTHQSLRLT
jgi:hypothetical protein